VDDSASRVERGSQPLRAEGGDIILLYTDKQVVVWAVRAWVSKSAALMAELRRLHRLCRRHGLILDIHRLPSVLNLYADRLSRRRRVVDYLPALEGVAHHWSISRSSVASVLGAPELAPGTRSNELRLADFGAESRSRQALASDSARLLSRRQDDGRATRLVANRVAGVADRLARSLPSVQGRAVAWRRALNA
jgi:hypothetical protein